MEFEKKLGRRGRKIARARIVDCILEEGEIICCHRFVRALYPNLGEVQVFFRVESMRTNAPLEIGLNEKELV